MKILQLRFANLNSLYGEWNIDFSAPDYTANGIFALTGPTGAGKSTILDAICLALYGSTPRLGRITKSANEIMSRRTGTCFAEVVFATQEGRFRCHWGQHRARKKPTGELQSPQHEISVADQEGKVLEHQLRRVLTVVEEKTGMDFERFTRSMLLAQGGFDTFLRADTEQKSALLEQITGTGIYTEISSRVHERQRSERETLKELEVEIKGIQVLSTEQEREISAELQVRQQEEQNLNTQLESATRALLWRKNLLALEQELNSLAQERSTLDRELADFAPRQQRLEYAQQATVLEGEYATLLGVRTQQQSAQEEIAQCQNRIPELEKAADEVQTQVQQAQQLHKQTTQELHHTLQRTQQVRNLDQQLKELQQKLKQLQDTYAADEKQIRTLEQQRAKAQQRRETLAQELDGVEQDLRLNKAVAALVPELGGIRTGLEQLEQLQQEVYAAQQKGTELSREVSETQQQERKHAKELNQQRDRVHKIEEEAESKRQELAQLLAGRKLGEYRREKDALQRELALLQRIAALEDQRAHLQEGQPCPLCGATAHPYATGEVPEQSETEARIEKFNTLIENAEGLQQEIEKMQAKAEQDRTALTLLKTRGATLEYAYQRAQERKEENATTLKELQWRYAAQLDPLQQRIEAFGAHFDPQVPQQSVAYLTQRVEEWQALEQRQTGLNTELTRVDAEVERLDAVLETRRSALEKQQQELEHQRRANEELQHQRHELFGDKDPDEMERCARQQAENAEQEYTRRQTRLQEAQQRLTEVCNRRETLKLQIDKRAAELKGLEQNFMHLAKEAGFASEAAFLEARLVPEERHKLEEESRQLHQRHLELQTRMQDRSAKLEQERARDLTRAGVEELEQQSEQLRTQLENVRGTRAELQHRLREHARAIEHIRDKEGAIRTQRQECAKWERLHGLIGSADGKKFRNFAQGLTFEMMVKHANAQLGRMSERYLLVRDTEHPLELNVMDNYQGGEVRSTRNLSGGESFIVSLSLALGLSSMASRNIRIDSLFLDEGFGTLDEDTLETALEALAGLHQEGKLIGVISHVGGLKERIPTRIKVKPQPGGKSALNGPGVVKG
ncbi:MAG: SbcC/MukB-like Walker B domain-containing protein [Thermodesulfobacteriota bacterium]